MNAQRRLEDDDLAGDFVSDDEKGDIEKVDFPSTNGSIPSFSEAFGTGLSFPPAAQMKNGQPTSLDPRSYSTPAHSNLEQYPQASRAPGTSNQVVMDSEKGLKRQESGSGQDGSGALNAANPRTKRWVIE